MSEFENHVFDVWNRFVRNMPCCPEDGCDRCRRMVRIEARQAYERKRREQKQNKKPVLTFSDVVKLADAEGLSYGKYCLKYGI